MGGPLRPGGTICGIINDDENFTDAPNYVVATSTNAVWPWIASLTGVEPNVAFNLCDVPAVQQVPSSESIKVVNEGASIDYGIMSSDLTGFRTGFDATINPMTYGAISGMGPASRKLVEEEVVPDPVVRPESPLIASLDGALTSGSVSVLEREVSGSGGAQDSEGYPGYRIDQIAGTAACSIPYYHPNLITLLAGTNDVQQNFKICRTGMANRTVFRLISQAN